MFAVIGGAQVLLFLLRKAWAPNLRLEHNELIGWHVSVLGTTYAVVLGFMLFAVWNDFKAAEINAENEANSLVNVFRFAEAFPPAQRDQIQNLAIRYSDLALTEEWPAMDRQSTSPSFLRVAQEQWDVIMKIQTKSPSETVAFDRMSTELTSLTQSRRVRELQSRTSLPPVLWAVLVAGCALTIVSSCMFGTENFRLHIVQVLVLSLLISLILVAIADINRPFQGSVHVPPTAFEHARDTFRSLLSARR